MIDSELVMDVKDKSQATNCSESDISELVEDLSFFFKDNPFMNIRMVRGQYESRISFVRDYESALLGAIIILKNIKEYKKEDSKDNTRCSISNSTLYFEINGEKQYISLHGITGWNEYGPIKQKKTEKDTVNYFKRNRKASIKFVERKIKRYIRHLVEIVKKERTQCAEIHEELVKSFLEADPTEYQARIAEFNSKWNGIQVFAPDFKDVPMNKILNPEYLSPFYYHSNDTISSEIDLNKKFTTDAYLDVDLEKAIDTYLTALQQEGIDYYYTLVFEGEGKFENVGAVTSYQEAAAKARLQSPTMVEVNIKDKDYTTLRLICDRSLSGKDRVEMINYAENFDMFAVNIQRLGNSLFSKKEKLDN